MNKQDNKIVEYSFERPKVFELKRNRFAAARAI